MTSSSGELLLREGWKCLCYVCLVCFGVLSCKREKVEVFVGNNMGRGCQLGEITTVNIFCRRERVCSLGSEERKFDVKKMLCSCLVVVTASKLQ